MPPKEEMPQCLVSYFPGGELSSYPFFHLLLSNLVGSLDIIMSGGKIRESSFQIR